MLYIAGIAMRKKIIKKLIFYFVLCSSALAQETMIFTLPDNSQVQSTYFILKEAYAKMGFLVNVERFPATRALYMSNEGFVDGEIHRIGGLNRDYPNLLQIPIPIGKLEGVVFTINKDFKVDGFDSLRPYRIGVRRGIVFAERGTKGMDVHRADSVEQLLRSLIAGHVDIIILNKLEGRQIEKLFPGRGIHELTPPVLSLDFYHYLHEKHAHLIPQLTEILAEMKRSGRIDELTNLHQAKD